MQTTNCKTNIDSGKLAAQTKFKQASNIEKKLAS